MPKRWRLNIISNANRLGATGQDNAATTACAMQRILLGGQRDYRPSPNKHNAACLDVISSTEAVRPASSFIPGQTNRR
jgi:hypothetical protein